MMVDSPRVTDEARPSYAMFGDSFKLLSQSPAQFSAVAHQTEPGR